MEVAQHLIIKCATDLEKLEALVTEPPPDEAQTSGLCRRGPKLLLKVGLGVIMLSGLFVSFAQFRFMFSSALTFVIFHCK